MRASFDLSPRQYKMLVRREHLLCPICPPNRGENRKRIVKRPIKKQWQLDPKRRHK